MQTAIVFGGSSGIGAATARVLRASAMRVVITGRDPAKLTRAADELGGVETAAFDARDDAALQQLLAAQARVDHVVICVSGGKGAGPFRELALDGLRAAFEEKTLAHLAIAQAAARKMRSGSITFVSAASARSRLRGTAGLAAVNAAIEAVVPILALELAPIRVNAVSPGVIDTPWWDAMPPAEKASFHERAGRALPVARIGTADEVAQAIALLVTNGFITGSVYEVDGGARLSAS